MGLLGGAALLSLPSVIPSRAAATDSQAPPAIRVGARAVNLADYRAEAQRIADEWASEELRVTLTEETLVRTRAELGGRVDVSHLTRLLSDAAALGGGVIAVLGSGRIRDQTRTRVS